MNTQQQHEYLARTRGPCSPCKWCGKQFADAAHIKEPELECWETFTRREQSKKEWDR